MATPTSEGATSTPTATMPSSLGDVARVERAQRVASMLNRWAEEDCSDEPEWDADAIEPLRLAAPADSSGGAP